VTETSVGGTTAVAGSGSISVADATGVALGTSVVVAVGIGVTVLRTGWGTVGLATRSTARGPQLASRQARHKSLAIPSGFSRREGFMRVASTPGWAKTYSGFLGTKSWLGRASLQTGNAPARTVYFWLRSIVNHLVGQVACGF